MYSRRIAGINGRNWHNGVRRVPDRVYGGEKLRQFLVFEKIGAKNGQFERISRSNEDDAHQAFLLSGGGPVQWKLGVLWLSSRLVDEWEVLLKGIEQPLPSRTTT